MSKTKVLKQLQENIKIIYHASVDADRMLIELRKDNKAGFNKIFSEETAFRTQATTFLPYVEELAEDLQEIQTDDSDDHYKTLLPSMIVKIELLFKTIETLKANLKD